MLTAKQLDARASDSYALTLTLASGDGVPLHVLRLDGIRLWAALESQTRPQAESFTVIKPLAATVARAQSPMPSRRPIEPFLVDSEDEWKDLAKALGDPATGKVAGAACALFVKGLTGSSVLAAGVESALSKAFGRRPVHLHRTPRSLSSVLDRAADRAWCTPLPVEYARADGTRYASGTVWELEDAKSANRPVFVYRCTKEPMLEIDDPEFDAKRAQFSQVKAFFDAMRAPDGSNLGRYTPYEDVNAL